MQVKRFFCTVADLRQVKLGEVPPLQAVGGVRDVAGDCRLTVSDRCTWEDRRVGFVPEKNKDVRHNKNFTSFVVFIYATLSISTSEANLACSCW